MPSPLIGLAGASLGGAALQSRAASKAADAQSAAAADANDTQRYMFDRGVELSEPYRKVGENALAALAFEAGVGPMPGASTGSVVSTPSGLSIQETTSPGQFTGEYGVYQGGRAEGNTNYSDPIIGDPTTSFMVGEQDFATRDEAQNYINSQANSFTAGSGGFEYSPIAFPDAQIDTSLNAFEASPGYQFRVDEGQKAMERAASARGMRMSGAAMKDAMRFGQGIASDEFGAFYGRQADAYNRSYGAAFDQRNQLASLAGVGQSAVAGQTQAGQQFASAYGANTMASGAAQAQGYQNSANAISGGINSLSGLYGMANSGYLGQNPGLGITPLANPFGG